MPTKTEKLFAEVTTQDGELVALTLEDIHAALVQMSGQAATAGRTPLAQYIRKLASATEKVKTK